MAINPFVLHVNKALTNVSVKYRNAAMVADQIFPTIPVNKQSDEYFVYGLDSLRPQSDTLAPRAKSQEIIMQRTPATFNAGGHGLSFPIADEDRASDDMGTMDIDATQDLMDKIFLNREIDIFTTVKNGVTNVDLSASSYANAFDTDAADPIKLIETESITIAKLTGKKPNTMVFSTQALAGFRNNALVKARITGAQDLDGSSITLQQIANVLNLKKVIEAAAVKNTALEGQTDALDFVWGKNALLCYVPDAPGLRTISLGYHFMWNYMAVLKPGDNPKAISELVPGGAGYGVRQWREEGRRTTMVEAVAYYAQKIVSANAGIFFSNAVQNY